MSMDWFKEHFTGILPYVIGTSMVSGSDVPLNQSIDQWMQFLVTVGGVLQDLPISQVRSLRSWWSLWTCLMRQLRPWIKHQPLPSVAHFPRISSGTGGKSRTHKPKAPELRLSHWVYSRWSKSLRFKNWRCNQDFLWNEFNIIDI